MRYLIIGAVAGGATAAARLRRLDENAEIILFEKGEFISYANCGLPYYIGEVIKDRNKLFVQTATAFNRRFNIDVRINTQVISIDRNKKTVTAVNVNTGKQYVENYDKLVLSPGAEPVKPPIPGVDLEGIFTLRNVNDTDAIKAYVTPLKTGRAVVIGAGFVGLEMAENLHGLGLKVTIIERGTQVLAPLDFPVAAIVQQHIRSRGIDLHLNSTVKCFVKDKNKLRVLFNDTEEVAADVIILSVGVKPDNWLALNGGLELGPSGGIRVNKFLQTSDSHIYAVGDAIEFLNPISGNSVSTFLAGPANKQGRICANNIVFGNKQEYKGSIQTAILKIFDLNAGATGLSSRQLRRVGVRHIISTIHSNSHAGYYPGAMQMTIQIAFSPDNGRLLGAQVVGGEGADKRLDVLAMVIKSGGTIEDLMEFEHAYAPPFSSAKDPVNIAGFVAENILLNRSEIFYCSDIADLAADIVLIDVRTPLEYSRGSIANAINIPLDDIRERIGEFPTDKPVYLFCQQGLRGYLAQQILIPNHCSRVLNLSGGYLLWQSYSAEIENLQEVY